MASSSTNPSLRTSREDYSLDNLIEDHVDMLDLVNILGKNASETEVQIDSKKRKGENLQKVMAQEHEDELLALRIFTGEDANRGKRRKSTVEDDKELINQAVVELDKISNNVKAQTESVAQNISALQEVRKSISRVLERNKNLK